MNENISRKSYIYCLHRLLFSSPKMDLTWSWSISNGSDQMAGTKWNRGDWMYRVLTASDPCMNILKSLTGLEPRYLVLVSDRSPVTESKTILSKTPFCHGRENNYDVTASKTNKLPNILNDWKQNPWNSESQICHKIVFTSKFGLLRKVSNTWSTCRASQVLFHSSLHKVQFTWRFPQIGLIFSWNTVSTSCHKSPYFILMITLEQAVQTATDSNANYHKIIKFIFSLFTY